MNNSDDLKAGVRYKQRSAMLEGAFKLWVTDPEQPQRLEGLRQVTQGNDTGVCEFIALLVASDVVPLHPDVRKIAFIVGSIEGLSYSDMSRVLDCSNGYISAVMKRVAEDATPEGEEFDPKQTRKIVHDAYKPRIVRAHSLLGVMHNSAVSADAAMNEKEIEDPLLKGLSVKPVSHDTTPRVMVDEPETLQSPQPQLQQQEDM